MSARVGPGRRRDERGAVAVLVALMLGTLLLPMCAIGVDLATQRVARRDMQSLADVVALDLSRLLDGRAAAVLTAPMDTARDRSVARNRGTVGSPPVVTYRLGAMGADGVFNPTVNPPTAVEVSARSKVDFSFASVFGVRSGAVARTAVGQAASGACFTLGSYAARLNTAGTPVLGTLLGLLGSNVALTAVDYTGLAGVDVDVATLLSSQVGALTLEQAIAGNNLVTLGGYYLAVANALARDGGSTAQVTLLRSVAATVQGVSVQAGKLIGLTTGGGAGLDATLNAFDLVTTGAQVASGASGLSLPSTSVGLGPLANVGVRAALVEGAKPGCGRKGSGQVLASTAQGRVDLTAQAADVSVPGLLRTNVSLSGSVSLASATGTLDDVRCSPTPGITVGVVNGLVDVNLVLQVTVSVNVLGFTVPVVSGPIRITGQKASSGQAVINIVDDDYSKPTTVGYGSSGLPVLTVNTSGLGLVGIPVGVALAPITNLLLTGLVNPIVQGLDPVVSTVLNTLGIDLSGADVFARPTPRCDEPNLVG